MKRLNITCVTNTPSFNNIYANANNIIEILSNINAQYDIKDIIVNTMLNIDYGLIKKYVPTRCSPVINYDDCPKYMTKVMYKEHQTYLDDKQAEELAILTKKINNSIYRIVDTTKKHHVDHLYVIKPNINNPYSIYDKFTKLTHIANNNILTSKNYLSDYNIINRSGDTIIQYILNESMTGEYRLVKYQIE